MVSKKINPIQDHDGEKFYFGIYQEDEDEKLNFYSLFLGGMLSESSLKDFKNLSYNKKPPLPLFVIKAPSEKLVSVVCGVGVGKKHVYINSMYNIHTQYTHTTYNVHLYILKHVEGVFGEYIELKDPRLFTLFALWSLGTYTYSMFNSYPYIYIHGLKGSGKSKLLDISSLISFNGLNLGSVSVSSAFRVIDLYRCSLFIDEMENISQKGGNFELRNILLNGYKKGTYFMRSIQKTSKAGDFIPEVYNIYSPKMMANIGGLDDVLESRSIYVNIKRAMTRKGETEINPEDEAIIKARDLGYIFAFNYWKDILKIYKEMENETKLKNRDFEIWKPMFAIAKIFGDEVYNEIKELAEEKTDEKNNEDSTETVEIVIIHKLKEYIYNKEDHYIPVKDIYNMVNNSNEFEWLNLNMFGKMMRRLGFNEKRRVSVGIEYLLRKDFIIELYERYVGKIEKAYVEEEVE